MTDQLCVCGCERPTPDGYAATACTDRARRQLAEIADMTPAARDVAHGQVRRGAGGGGSNKPESRLPFDLSATARLDAVQGELVTWTRHICAERGVALPAAGCADDLIVELARWLPAHLEWIRHRAEVAEFLAAVDACARVVRGLARGPSDQRYLGPCGALSEPESDHGAEIHPRTLVECPGDVYGPQGGQKGHCRTCGTPVAQSERRAWLDDEVRSRAFRAAEIASAYGLNVKTIRTWANRGKLTTWWADALGSVWEWEEPEQPPELPDEPTNEQRDARQARLDEIEEEIEGRGPKLFLVGDVLDLAAADAARREQARAERAAAQAAITEEATA